MRPREHIKFDFRIKRKIRREFFAFSQTCATIELRICGDDRGKVLKS